MDAHCTETGESKLVCLPDISKADLLALLLSAAGAMYLWQGDATEVNNVSW